jgi:hypothetical protein
MLGLGKSTGTVPTGCKPAMGVGVIAIADGKVSVGLNSVGLIENPGLGCVYRPHPDKKRINVKTSKNSLLITSSGGEHFSSNPF